MGRIETTYRLEDLRFLHTCTVCNKSRSVRMGSRDCSLTDCECGAITRPTEEIVIVGGSYDAIRSLEDIGRVYIERYVSDLDIVIERIRTHGGRFLIGMRKLGGCDHILLDLGRKRAESEGLHVFGALNNKRFFYYGTYFREVSREEAEIIWRAECI